MNLLYIFSLFFMIKLLINGTKYFKTKYYFNNYAKWVGGHEIPLKQMQFSIIKLFKDAKISDHYFADVTPLDDVTEECEVTSLTAPTATDACEGTIIGTTTDPTSYSAQGTYSVTNSKSGFRR